MVSTRYVVMYGERGGGGEVDGCKMNGRQRRNCFDVYDISC